MEESLRPEPGRAAGDRAGRRAIRTAAAVGFGMATMDVREHASAHHALVGKLFDLVGGSPPGYSSLAPDKRARLLADELSSRRPLVGPTTRLEGDHARCACSTAAAAP